VISELGSDPAWSPAVGPEVLRDAVEAMRETLAIVTPVRDDGGELIDLRYVYVNDAFCASAGRTRDQLVGRLGSELTADFATTARFAAFREVLTTGVATRIETGKTPRPQSGADGACSPSASCRSATP
jgi:PAS domain-containing protein